MKSIKKFIFKHRYLALFLLVFISRIIFVDGSIDFFDSSQYLWRSKLDSIVEALSTGHGPFHPGYVFFTYTFWHLLRWLKIGTAEFAITLPSAIFGSLAILFFYLISEKIFNKKVALLASVLAALTPFLWIGSVTILIDPTMICFYLISLYLFLLWLEKQNYVWLILSGISFGISMFTHTQIGIWALGFAALFILKVEPKDWILMILKSAFWILGPAIFIIFYLLLLVHAGHNQTYKDALVYLFTGNINDRMPLGILPGIRLLSIQLSFLGLLITFLGILKLYFADFRKFIFLVVWLLPGAIISALYLYANLYGRAGTMAIFPATLAMAWFLLNLPTKAKFLSYLRGGLIGITIFNFALISLPTVISYGFKPSPYQELDVMRKTLTPGGVFIGSNLSKTLVSYEKFKAIWEQPQKQIDQEINDSLKNKKPIYLGSDAIFFPAYKYDGQNWEILSTDIKTEDQGTLSRYLFGQFNADVVEISPNFKTSIYQLYKDDQKLEERISKNISILPEQKVLVIGKILDESNTAQSQMLVNAYSNKIFYRLSAERINYRDPLFFIYKVIKNNPDPLLWSFSDKSGVFAFALPSKQTENLNLKFSSFPKISKLPSQGKIYFSQRSDSNLEISKEDFKKEELKNILENLPRDKSFILILKKENDNLYYKLQIFSYNLPQKDFLSSLQLASETGIEIEDPNSQSGKVKFSDGKGYLSFGPWINLPEGTYLANFKIKSKKPQTEPVANLEISSGSGGKMLAEKELKKSDFKNDNQYQNFELKFTLDELSSGIEFRTKVLNNPLYLDNISLEKID